MIPNVIKNFIEAFRKLPGIGPRAATRLAFFIGDMDEETRGTLASSLKNLGALERCERCFFIKEEGNHLCQICGNAARDQKTIAIVEKDTDILTLERAREFKGTYLVLGTLEEHGVLEESHKKRLEHLKKRITEELGGSAEEIILAINPHAFGDMLYEIIKRDCKNMARNITRL
ncbi:MAG: toprim domain-containing protein, partial [Patescibacteria group bacterium]